MFETQVECLNSRLKGYIVTPPSSFRYSFYVLYFWVYFLGYILQTFLFLSLLFFKLCNTFKRIIYVIGRHVDCDKYVINRARKTNLGNV